MKTQALISYIGEFSLLILLIIIVGVFVVIIISKRRKKSDKQSKIQFEVDNVTMSYKKAIEIFKNLSMDYPNRLKNLKLVFCNIESIREAKSKNDIEKQISLCAYYEKKRIIRQIVYSYVFDLFSYFSEKFSCYKTVDLLSFKKLYNDAINFNLQSNFERKFDILEVLLVNFSDISLKICEKMTDSSLKKRLSVKCKNKILKECFELEDMVLKLKLKKNSLKIENYTTVLELFEHKMLSILELFDYIEKILH